MPSSVQPITHPRRRAWVIPAIIAAVAFLGGLATELVADYIKAKLDPYSPWVWAVFIVALIVAIIAAIREADSSKTPPSESPGSKLPPNAGTTAIKTHSNDPDEMGHCIQQHSIET